MRKNVIDTAYTLFTSATMTGADVLTSASVGVKFLDNLAIDLSWTGTPTGTFVIQESLDGTTWRSLDFGSAISASGSAGNHQIYLNQVPFYFIRVVYTNASGAGALNGKITAKMV